MKKKLAVFISGQGSNLSVFLQNKENFAELLVVSSHKEAYGLEKAKRFGVEGIVLPRPIDWGALDKILRDKGIELIFLAGFMKIIPPGFVEKWNGQLFNLHPSFLPKYEGLNSIERAFNDKEAIGVSIHKVTPEVDAGEILFQKEAVSSEAVKELSLQEAEFNTHVCEQKLVRDWIKQWA